MDPVMLITLWDPTLDLSHQLTLGGRMGAKAAVAIINAVALLYLQMKSIAAVTLPFNHCASCELASMVSSSIYA